MTDRPRTSNSLPWLLVGAVVSGIIGLLIFNLWPPFKHSLRQALAPQTTEIFAGDWQRVRNTTVGLTADGATVVSSPPGAMRWYGVFLRPSACNYRLDVDIKLEQTIGTEQFGYAVAPAANVDNQGTPHGRAFQYDVSFKLRQPDYPHDEADDVSGYIDALTEYLDGVPIVIDFQRHHWTILVSGHRATASIDGHPLRPIELTARKDDACAGGIYIRVWNGTIQIGSVTISKSGFLAS